MISALGWGRGAALGCGYTRLSTVVACIGTGMHHIPMHKQQYHDKNRIEVYCDLSWGLGHIGEKYTGGGILTYARVGFAGGESRALSPRMFICALWIWWRQSTIPCES